ncbi:unnamed protein product, partial [Thlaspi arvense]
PDIWAFPCKSFTLRNSRGDLDAFCLHILIISGLRIFIYQLWTSCVNMLFLTGNRRILQQGVDFKQIDKEGTGRPFLFFFLISSHDLDNFIILQALMASVAYYVFPFLSLLPLWDPRSFIAATLLHVVVSEPLYYWVHRCFHGDYLFTHYHSLHHSSPVPQPLTAGSATFLEHLILTAVIGLPVLGSCTIGYGSISMIYGYVLVFDFLRCLGHSNVEIVPRQLFEKLPFLKYLLYTPTYHSLHHEDMCTNYCLFMPLFDALGDTLNTKSWEPHKRTSSNAEL